jgi:hypothetical protein
MSSYRSHLACLQREPAHTGKIKLSNGKNNFERAIEDTFSLSKLQNVVGRCRLALSKPELKESLVSAPETEM